MERNRINISRDTRNVASIEILNVLNASKLAKSFTIVYEECLWYPSVISGYAHAIGQRSSRAWDTRDRIFVSLFCLPATWRTIFGDRAAKHARHVASGRNFKRVTLSARASLARSACFVQVSGGIVPVTCRRRRSGMSPSVIAREPSKLTVRALKQQSSLVFRVAGMLSDL